MTWEDIYKKLCERAINDTSPLGLEVAKVLKDELCDCIIMKKGKRRHYHASVYHAFAEGIATQYSTDGVNWFDMDTESSCFRRIKPSEPVYEWQWYVGIIYGIDAVTEGFYTEEEIGAFPFRKKEETKRERK